MGRPGPRLSEDERQQRADEVYRLHCRGWTQRAIARQLELELAGVNRALQQARRAIRKAQGEEHLADLAQELTEGSRDDLADSWRLACQIEEMALARAALQGAEVEAALQGDVAQQNLPTQPAAIAADYRTIAAERANRSALRRDIARFNGLDKVEVQIDVSPRLAAAFAQATAEYVAALKASRLA